MIIFRDMELIIRYLDDINMRNTRTGRRTNEWTNQRRITMRIICDDEYLEATIEIIAFQRRRRREKRKDFGVIVVVVVMASWR